MDHQILFTQGPQKRRLLSFTAGCILLCVCWPIFELQKYFTDCRAHACKTLHPKVQYVLFSIMLLTAVSSSEPHCERIGVGGRFKGNAFEYKLNGSHMIRDDRSTPTLLHYYSHMETFHQTTFIQVL